MEKEYIEKKEIVAVVNELPRVWDKKCCISRLEYLKIRINNILPAADAVEVVRCKDCINWKKDAYGGVCDRYGVRLDKDWFCAGGQRREK